MTPRIVTMLCALCIASGYLLCQKLESGGETKTRTVEVVKNNIVTVTKVVEKPDGSKETVSTTTDNSVVKTDNKTVVVAAANKPQWHVSAAYTLTDRSYGLTVQRRILGPVFAGVSGGSTGTVGLVLGLEF